MAAKRPRELHSSFGKQIKMKKMVMLDLKKDLLIDFKPMAFLHPLTLTLI